MQELEGDVERLSPSGFHGPEYAAGKQVLVDTGFLFSPPKEPDNQNVVTSQVAPDKRLGDPGEPAPANDSVRFVQQRMAEIRHVLAGTPKSQATCG